MLSSVGLYPGGRCQRIYLTIDMCNLMEHQNTPESHSHLSVTSYYNSPHFHQFSPQDTQYTYDCSYTQAVTCRLGSKQSARCIKIKNNANQDLLSKILPWQGAPKGLQMSKRCKSKSAAFVEDWRSKEHDLTHGKRNPEVLTLPTLILKHTKQSSY